jgi:predicted phage-related endonuclease
MGVMGIKHGAVAWISSFPVFNAGYKEIDFNPSYYAMIVQAVEEFWNGNILTGTPPEPEELEDLRVKYSGKNQTVKGESFVADDWMQADYDELLGIKSQMDILKDRKKELEDELEKAIMGYAAIYAKDGETLLCTRVPKAPKPSLDKELLRKEYESIYDKYLLVQEAVFNESLFKKECRELYDQYLVTPEAGDPEFKVSYPRKTATRKAEAIF